MAMRVIGGVARGKLLHSPPDTTRPTSDRAREGLFSTLTSEFGSIEHLRFLDLFSGSGAIGAEALSRGAAHVDCVEHHGPTAKICQENLALINNASGDFQVVSTKVEKFLADFQERHYDIIFMDPPYEVANQVIEEMLDVIGKSGFLKPDGVIVVERESKAPVFKWPTPFAVLKVRTYGQGSMYYGYIPH
jgi:16S rRNA (guanine966-N2)-methyltransferase